MSDSYGSIYSYGGGPITDVPMADPCLLLYPIAVKSYSETERKAFGGHRRPKEHGKGECACETRMRIRMQTEDEREDGFRLCTCVYVHVNTYTILLDNLIHYLLDETFSYMFLGN